ncbi:MAG: TolC family protein [Phycisphaerales bacterium]|nr:TolC family protein [Phycisphaerales bacterium]
MTTFVRKSRGCGTWLIRPAMHLLTYACAALLSGCADWARSDADRSVNRALRTYESRTLADRADWVRQPRETPPPASQPTSAASLAETSEPGAPTTASAKPRLLDLRDSLRTAFENGREYKTERESLYLAGLNYTFAQYTFGPILDSTIRYLWNYNEGTPNTHSVNVPISVSQILPLGGTASASASLNGVRTRGGEPESDNDFRWTSDMQVNLQQPLLRGAGYEASHEPLTQAERALIYAVRDFELFRQDYSIRVADAYYSIVRQRKQLENDEQSYSDAVYDRQKADALRSLDRNKPDDVFQARRREIEAENQVIAGRTRYKLALDEFKILLGLPIEAPISIGTDEPPYEPVNIESQSAVDVALHNRLDLHTRRDQVEDTRRRLRIARQDLLPQFDLTAEYGMSSLGGRADDATPNQRRSSVGLALEVPLDRVPERNAYREALISLDRSERDLDQTEDRVRIDILNALRELTQFEKQIQLQEDQIRSEQRAVAVMQIRVEAGDAQQRDLTEARRSLTDAMNQLIDLKVQHFIARLRLKRNLGILFIDQNGMWMS